MGGALSSIDSNKLPPDSPILTDSQGPNSSNPTTTTPSDPKTQTTQEPENPSIETKPTKQSYQKTKPSNQNQKSDQEGEIGEFIDQDEGEEEEGEGEGECGFCLFMKGGGCKDAFIDWENCVKEGENQEEDIVNKCFEVTSALRKCMEAHADYYEALLKIEKDAEELAMKELEKEKALEMESKTELVIEEKGLESNDSNSGK